MIESAGIHLADEKALRALVGARLRRPVAEDLRALAARAAAAHGFERGVRAVLAYGSTLRDASLRETLADLYVLSSDFAHVSPNPFSRLGCRLVPPNVYYLACDCHGERLRAKYACLPMAQFARRLRPDVRNPYFWARFAQPARLVWRAEAAAGEEVEELLAQAVVTALVRACLLVEVAETDWRGLWRRLLAATYASELRVESAARAEAIIAADEEWFRETTRAVFGAAERVPVKRLRAEIARHAPGWRAVRWQGRALSVLRLMKAAFTFTGGADYIAFKIERHSGERIELSGWQRRHPIIAGLLLLPKLLRKGVVK